MTPYPETIGGVLWNLLSILRDNWGLFVTILVIISSAVAIAAFIDNKTEKRISKLRKALSENPKYEKLIREVKRDIGELHIIVIDEIDFGWDTRTVSKRDTKALRKLLNFRAEHPLGGFLALIGIK
jgi:hypothetical protein